MRFLILAALVAGAAPPSGPRTIRVDYFHSGDAVKEEFSLDGVAREGEWPGRLDRPLDDTNLGKYFFEVIDRKTNRALYSRGFASIYGEWETTDEAKEMRRTFHESVRFPDPGTPVQVVLKKRDRQNAFREVWSVVIDPQAATVDQSRPPAAYRVWPVMRNGEPRDKVDLLLIGDGYTETEMDKWHRDAQRLTDVLFNVSPFRERRNAFNVWALDAPADESGVSRPSDSIWRKSPVRASYDAFGSERYVLTFDNKRLREAAAAAPYEFIEIVVNDRKYGGGGIHNLYATVAADNASTPYVFVHEFGHHFAGLADEYYTSDVAYETGAPHPEPWEPNATIDPHAAKWKDLIEPGTPLPTPWPKAQFEALEKDIQAKRRQIRAEKTGERDGSAVRGRTGARGAVARRRPMGQQGRRVRRRDVRSEGLLSPAIRLHHVQSEHEPGVLCCMPASYRARHRPVREVISGRSTRHRSLLCGR